MESDTGIVAEKPANKAVRAATERVEPRPVRSAGDHRVTGGQYGEPLTCRQRPEVGAVCANAHVRICAGGAGQPASLPRKYVRSRRYPEFFSQVQYDLCDDRSALAEVLKQFLVPRNTNNSVLYDLIATWPFACYLTTNYDDEIEKHLRKHNQNYTVVRNRPADFHIWRDGSRGIIQKLHSDLEHPKEMILTSLDYQRLYVDDSGKYFRDALCRVFATYDCLIIGHSLSDPDIDYVLKLARLQRGPEHPVYMIAADFTPAHEREYFEKYNIVLIQYSNSDGTHSELKQLLRRENRFISARDRVPARLIAVRSGEQTKAAMAVFLYRRLLDVQSSEYLSPLVLTGLASQKSGKAAIDRIHELPVLHDVVNNTHSYKEAVDDCIGELTRQQFVVQVGSQVAITRSGRLRVEEYQRVRNEQSDSAYSDFVLCMERNHKRYSRREISNADLSASKSLSEKIIVTTFADRGSMIANKIFFGANASPEEMSDVFESITDYATQIENLDSRMAFVDAMHEFLVEPSDQQKEYLTSVSQGYFLYHLLGLDPRCGEARREVFERTLWLCDSSIILPRMAIGCSSNEFAADLLSLMTEENALLYTTSRLVQELWNHLKWAVDFMRYSASDSIEFLRAALLKGSYRKNLFLEGYIRLSADGTVHSFEDYLRIILPNGRFSRATFEEYIESVGLRVVKSQESDDLVKSSGDDLERTRIDIERERQERGTYRSLLQVEAEAEISVLLRNLKSGISSIPGLKDAEHFYFVSQSRIIDDIFPLESVTTWSPEALYRYLTTLPGHGTIRSDLLQQCMLEDYYYAGISFVDKRRYMQFFGSAIDAAKASFEREVDRYVKDIEELHVGSIRDAFTNTDELDKPFFVAQMGWRMAQEAERRGEFTSQRLSDAEKRIRDLELYGAKALNSGQRGRRRQELARRRNLQNPQHVRKRRRQARKRNRRKSR